MGDIKHSLFFSSNEIKLSYRFFSKFLIPRNSVENIFKPNILQTLLSGRKKREAETVLSSPHLLGKEQLIVHLALLALLYNLIACKLQNFTWMKHIQKPSLFFKITPGLV